jgi:hypothetical protein
METMRVVEGSAQMDDTVVAAIDVGKVANVGWWRAGGTAPQGGRDLDELCDRLIDDLVSERRVALGFEAPLWVPLAKTTSELGQQRPGEGTRSWGAGAGAAVLACALQQSVYVLRRISAGVGSTRVTVDPTVWLAGAAALLVWEAFVTGAAKDHAAAEPHISDARAAVTEFARRAEIGELSSDLVGEDAISIGGVALVVAGLTTDLSVLTRPILVIKAPPLPTHASSC